MAFGKSSPDGVNSSIGENSYFTGKFLIHGSLRIDGKFEGKSLQVDQLTIGVTGRVKTNITAGSVIVEGTVIGNISAKGRVMLLPTAKILGDIRTPELIIQNGVVLDGRCLISPDSKDSVKELIETEYAKDGHSQEKYFGKPTGS